MGPGFSREISLPSPEATDRLAARIAPHLVPGDTLLLSGPLGAGKSHFARGIISARLAAAGRSEDIPSPTFTLIQTYDDGEAEIWHADLYRLEPGRGVAELGLEEAFECAICLVEWPDRLGALGPESPVALAFAYGAGESARVLTLGAAGPPRWIELADG